MALVYWLHRLLRQNSYLFTHLSLLKMVTIGFFQPILIGALLLPLELLIWSTPSLKKRFFWLFDLLDLINLLFPIFLSSQASIDKLLLKALWKSKSPSRVNILLWIMVYGTLNCSTILQRKLPPSVCHLCLAGNEDLQHIFFYCAFAKCCWWKLFSIFNLVWAFNEDFKSNVISILIGPALKESPDLTWINVVKAVIAEIWFERNQRVFHNNSFSW